MSKPTKPIPAKNRRKFVHPLFHLQTQEEDDCQLTNGMIKVVRKTGQLNLSGRALTAVPVKMFTMYDVVESENTGKVDLNRTNDDSWWNFQPLTYLDLSSNVLSEIPADIGVYQDLQTLNLQDNKLAGLPPQIGQLTRLTKLNISHNELKLLPEELFKLTELQVLNLKNNQLEQLSKKMGDLVMLQQLDISKNNLVTIPPDLGFLVRLTEINLSHNKLTELPPDFTNLRGLIKLDVTHNLLKELPTMKSLRKLQFIYAQHNDIEKLPEFDGCENVEQLYFGNNFITTISSDFCENMQHLKILDLRDNQIETLPSEVIMLQKLIRLDLTNNSLTALPNTLGLLPHLQNLLLEGNKMRCLRQDVIKGGTIRILKYLREKLDAEEAPKIPMLKPDVAMESPRALPDKYKMKSSRALTAGMKDLTCVPDEVFEEASTAEVTSVDLCKNKLVAIPDGLQKLTDLFELVLSQNQIKEVPDFMGNFTKLQYLDLGQNCISDFPSHVGKLTCLRELILSQNRLTKIPSPIYNLVGLEILLLGDNQIEEINVESLQHLKRLATLDLSNNNIAFVPPELGNMRQLRNLKLIGNSFRQPRYAVLQQGTDSILSYLRDRIPQ